MVGILVYIIYLIVGMYVSLVLLNKLCYLEKISIGIAFGIILSIWLPTLGSMVLSEFNIAANIIAIVMALLIAGGLYFYNRKFAKVKLISEIKSADVKMAVPVFAAIIPFMILMIVLFDGHILKQAQGGLYGGQSTYGDLPMHLGMITSIFEQGKFPPDYNILPGTRLSYPFLVNLQSAAMCIFGTSLRTSVIVPSIVMSLSCFFGVFALSRNFARKNSTAVLAMCLFFITGGLGFIYFLDSKELFLQIFTGFYKTPTNNMDFNLRWVNIICDMMIPQRTFLAGLSVVVPSILLLKAALTSKNVKGMMLAGLMASTLPMIHTHSFLALGILCAGMLLINLLGKDFEVKEVIKLWGVYLVPVILFAAPQLIFWVFTQTEGFLKIHFDWVNEDNSFLWFWLKNLGLVFVLIIPAFINAKKEMKLWFLSATMIFVLAEIIVFQPNIYDNNKLMIIWYIFVCILTADYLVYLYSETKNIRGRMFFVVITIVVLFMSGTLTIAREINSNAQYLHFKDSQVETAEAIDENCADDALFLTGRQHVNEISSLTGRNIYAGSTLYLYFHGLDYDMRYSEMEKIFEDAEYAVDALKAEKIDYIYISSYEWNDFDIDARLYDEYPIVYSNADVNVLAVSDKAIKKGAWK